MDTIGLTPEQLGIPLASAIHTPVTSCISPVGFAILCAAHLMRTEYRGTARADRDLVHLLDEGLEILAAVPRRERLAGEKYLLRPRRLVHADRRRRSFAEMTAIEFVGERIPEGGLTFLVDRDASGAAVLDDEHPVGPVPVFARELFVLSAVDPRYDRGEQAGQVLDAFDYVSESLVYFREFVHDSDRKTGKTFVRYQVTADAGKGADGKRRKVRRRYATERDARNSLAEITGGVVDGTFVARSSLTIEQICADWLAGMDGIEPTTRAAYENALQPLRVRHGFLPVQQLTKSRLDHLVTDLVAGTLPGQRRGWTANSVNPMLNS